MGGSIGALIGFGGCYAITQETDAWFGGLIVWIIVGGIGAGIGHAIGKSKVSSDIAPESHANDFPAVQDLVRQGWEFGDGPV